MYYRVLKKNRIIGRTTIIMNISPCCILLLLFTLIASGTGFSQVAFQPLPSPINNSVANEYMPSLSGNGRTLLYSAPMGDYDEQKFCIATQKNGGWSSPEIIPQVNTEAKKLYTSGHFLSYDGSQIYFSSAKFGGVGGNDIWVSNRQGNTWSAAINLGKPINSSGSDIDPSLSSDGRFLFFTRTDDKKTTKGKPCGKIYMSQKLSKENWDEPKLLPSPINIGCECNARLLPDQKGLSFASQRAGGKGGYDQYIAQWNTDGSWATPKPIANINTVEDDLYISIPAGGDYVYYAANTKTNTDIGRSMLPNDLKPSKSMLITATVKLADNVANTKSSTVVYKNAKSYLVYPNQEGRYFIALAANDDVEIAYQADYKKYLPQLIRYKLDTLTKYKELSTEIMLKPIVNNCVYQFSKYPLQGTEASLRNEHTIVARLIRENPLLKFFIEYLEPSLEQSKKDSSAQQIIATNNQISEARNDAEMLMKKITAGIYNANIELKAIEQIYPNTTVAEYASAEKKKVMYLKITK